MGPKGRNVVIDKKYGSPTITRDGVTVAREIELKDHYENVGAQMLTYFVTDAGAWRWCSRMLVLIYEKKLSVMKDMLPLLEQVARDLPHEGLGVPSDQGPIGAWDRVG